VRGISGVRELYAHELRTMLWVEQTLTAEVLPELLSHVHATNLVWALERHLLETEDHVESVRRLLDRIDEPREPAESAAFAGLRRDYDRLMELLDPGDEALVDVFHLGVIARTEQLEIAAYTGLVQMALALGAAHEDVVLLRVSLEQEQHALEQAEHALAKLLAEKVAR